MIKSSGSVGANYIEANEKLGEKDLKLRLKISRKEAKEPRYWLTLPKGLNPEFDMDTRSILTEAEEPRKKICHNKQSVMLFLEFGI